MKRVLCPLSKSSKIALIDTIRAADLIKMYNKWLNCDITSEFGTSNDLVFYHCLDCDLKFFFPMISGSEWFYEKLQKIDWYYKDNKIEYDYTKQFIKRSDLVLEIGCGKGAFARNISQNKYTGLEFSQKAIDMARRNGIIAQKEAIQSHAKKNSEKYDVVCAFQVLEHIADVRTFIDASLACLKPKGLLIYSTPSADSFISILRNPITNMPPHHVTWWSDRCLENIAKIFGIKLLSLKHEILADHNKKLFAHAIIFKSLENLLGMKRSLVNRSFINRVIGKIALLGAKVLEKGLVDYRVLPRGHTVMAIYRK